VLSASTGSVSLTAARRQHCGCRLSAPLGALSAWSPRLEQHTHCAPTCSSTPPGVQREGNRCWAAGGGLQERCRNSTTPLRMQSDTPPTHLLYCCRQPSPCTIVPAAISDSHAPQHMQLTVYKRCVCCSRTNIAVAACFERHPRLTLQPRWPLPLVHTVSCLHPVHVHPVLPAARGAPAERLAGPRWTGMTQRWRQTCRPT
jgi:hypothetical protein